MKHFFLVKLWVIKLLTVLKEVVIKRKIFFSSWYEHKLWFISCNTDSCPVNTNKTREEGYLLINDDK